MKYTDGTLILTMVSAFSRPLLKLGIKAVDIMEAYYDALQTPRPPKMNELITAGGNSYADLKLTIITFGGSGRVDVTPAALGVDIRDAISTAGGTQQAKEHFALCENTLLTAIEGIQISERIMRAQLWLTCEGGAEAVEQFMIKRGDAAFKFQDSPYAELKRKFSLEVRAVNPSAASRIELKIEPAVALRDLFIDFAHASIGSPTVETTVAEHFDDAEKEMLDLLNHIGLVSGIENNATA